MKTLFLCFTITLSCVQMRDDVHTDLLYFRDTVEMMHINLKSNEMSYTKGQRERNALQVEVIAAKEVYFNNLIEYQKECE